MAETIRGINVVIGAETTGLSKALSDVNKKSKDIQSELKQVEKLLKLDPTNTELVAQKQKLLADAVSNTTNKLDQLKAAQEQVNQQFSKGEISEGQYRAFQREIAKTEQELRGFESQVDSSVSSVKKLGKEAESVGSKLKGIGEGFKGVGEKMSIGLTAPLAGIVALATEGSEETRKFMSRLETNAQTAGVELKTVNDAMRDLNAITGETDSNVEAVSQLLATGFKGDQFKQLLDELTGAAIKFSDTLKIEGLADGLQETLATGKAIGPFAELLDRSGVSLDVFNAGLAEANKNGTTQQYVLEQLAKLGLADVNKQYRENNKQLVDNANANYDLQQSLAQLGELLLPIVTAITSKVAELLNWFNGLDESTQKVILVFAGIVAAIGPLLIVVGQLITAIGAIIPIFTAVSASVAAAGGALAILTSPITIVISAIAALVAGLVYLYNTNETVKNALTSAWEYIKSTAETIFLAIATVVKQIFGDLQNWWKQWGGTITGIFKNLFEILKIIFKTAFDLIFGVVKVVFDGLKSFWDTWGKTITILFTTVFNVVKSVFQGVWNNIKIIIETVIGVISGIIKTFLAVLKGDWAGAWEAVKGVAESIWNGIKQMFSNIGSTMLNIGKDIMQGLINGIKSMGSAVWESAKDVANGIADSFKDFFGIHSPARLTWGYGENIAQGLANGIAQAGKQAVKSAANVSAAVAGAMQYDFNGVTSTASKALNGVQGQGSSSVTNQYNMNGLFNGASIVIRSDDDIRKLGQEFGNVIRGNSRGLGGAAT